MSYERQERTGGIEINVFALLRVIAKKIWIVLALALIFGIIGAGAASVLQEESKNC